MSLLSIPEPRTHNDTRPQGSLNYGAIADATITGKSRGARPLLPIEGRPEIEPNDSHHSLVTARVESAESAFYGRVYESLEGVQARLNCVLETRAIFPGHRSFGVLPILKVSVCPNATCPSREEPGTRIVDRRPPNPGCRAVSQKPFAAGARRPHGLAMGRTLPADGCLRSRPIVRAPRATALPTRSALNSRDSS